MQYNLLVVDDNDIERHVVAMILQKLPEVCSVKVCSDPFEAKEVLETQQIDVVLSDIEMPGMSGLEMRQSLENPPLFIFITSYATYAADSFDVDAIDFVVKPITAERVLKAVRKAFEYLVLRQAAAANPANKPSEILDTPGASDDHFFIKESKGITRLEYSDVRYIEGMRDFSKIFRTQDREHVVLSGLKSLSAQLPETIFKRAHKQYIVNLNHVETIGRNEVILKDKTIIALSAAYRNELTDAFVQKTPIRRN